MNAGGTLNTCKSSGNGYFGNCFSGGRVSNTWVTYPIQGDNVKKFTLIPHKPTGRHLLVGKAETV